MPDQYGDPWLGAWRSRPDAREKAASDVARLGWLYVSRLVEDRRSDELIDLLARLGNSDLSYLRALRFLESAQTTALIAAGTALLRKLPQAVRLEKDTIREVRGRVDWASTVKERLSRGRDLTIFSVIFADKHSDTPENRALCYVLLRIAEAGRTVGDVNAAQLGREAERLLSNSALAGVKIPLVLSSMDRQILRMSRISEFRDLVTATLNLHDGLFSDDLHVLRRMLGERIWIPPEADKLFELWVLFTTVQSLEAEGWHVASLRLIGAGKGDSPTFIVRRGSYEVHIAYQAMPPSFARNSRYKEIINLYDINGALRRPDILLSAHGRAGVLHLLVEVKLTDNRDYIVDSIYKVLGYITDFQDSLTNSPNPKAILVVWNGVSKSDLNAQLVQIIDCNSVGTGKLVRVIEALAEASSASPP